MNVAILGASEKPDRYSYKAFARLRELGHRAFPLNPRLKSIEGVPVVASLAVLPEPVDTVTVYLSAARSDEVADELVAARPRRVIFNPGAENPALAERLRAAGVLTLDACTLVLLATGAF